MGEAKHLAWLNLESLGNKWIIVPCVIINRVKATIYLFLSWEPVAMTLNLSQFLIATLRRILIEYLCRFYMRNVRVYLVVVDIRIVDCHMYPGEPCPPSLLAPQVLYSHIYRPRPQCNTSTILYASLFSPTKYTLTRNHLHGSAQRFFRNSPKKEDKNL